MKWLIPLLMTLVLVPAASEASKKKKKFDTWNLNVKFIVGTDQWKADEAAVRAFLAEQVAEAERLFADKPRLKIKYSIDRKTSLGGKPTNYPTFKTNKKYRKWMDKYVDNVARSKTDGHLTVLVVDEFCIENSKKKRKKTGRKYKCPGGRAWFPHWVTPFSRKTGIALRYGNDKHTLAHEIGHMLSLRHTFEAYVNIDAKLNCNKEYKPKSLAKGRCRSCNGTRSGSGDSATCSGDANFMDYCFTTTQYINSCQKRRAANQRRKYMTKKGKTNYRKLKGIH
jgi:hypothetical protein